MKTLGLLLVATLAISGCYGVDRNNFKSCDQSGFCKRLRAIKPDKSQYSLNVDTVIVHGNVLSAEVVTLDIESEKKTVLWRYALRLSALLDGTFRVEIDEADPLYPRYRTQLALDGEPKPDGLKLISNENGILTLANNQGNKVIIKEFPLKLEFYNKAGDVAVILNDNAQLIVEPLRVRKEKTEDEDGNSIDVVEEEGTWSENFKSHHDSKPRGNEGISLDIAFPEADQVYGIPEHTDRFHLKTTTGGEPYRLYNLDVFEYELDSRMAIYGAVPVMYSQGPKRSAGVFWHNSAETWVDVINYADSTVVSSLVNLVTGGQKRRLDARQVKVCAMEKGFTKGQSDNLPGVDSFMVAQYFIKNKDDTAAEIRGAKMKRFMSESGIIDVFVFLGEKPTDVLRQYTALTGPAPLPPKFSLAYHQSRWNYVDEADVRQVDDNFDTHDIPMDVVWLDIEYTDRKKYFTWDPEKFAHPHEMVSNLTAKGRKLVVIIDPHIKREAGYFLHEDCLEKDFYVKDKDGKVYEGWCWPGSSSYPDFFDPAVSEYYAQRYKFENFPGTSNDVHLWNDMNEPSVFNGPEITMPKDCRHYKPPQDGNEGLASYWEHRHVHNEYGLWNIRATHEGMQLRSDHKYRPFILTRSTFAGTQRYAAVWTGDNSAEWGHLAATVPMCLSLSAAGVSFCGADVGGFFKYPEHELMTRWYQAGAFQPFFRAHSHIETKRREPWLYEPSTTALLRDANRRRYALIDFWYTLFYEHSIDGLPVMRAIFHEYPQEEDSYVIDDQYLLGKNLLIKPVVEAGVSTVSVYLPGALSHTVWYDVDTYQQHAAGRHNQHVTISKIPVYQRGGSIIPRKERIRRSSVLMADDPYTLAITLDVNGTAEGSIYIDDGETYEYKQNKYIYAKFNYNSNGITYKFVNEKASYPTRAWVERIVIAGIKTTPKTAKLVQNDKTIALQMTLHKGNDVLVIRKPGANMAQPWSINFSN